MTEQSLFLTVKEHFMTCLFPLRIHSFDIRDKIVTFWQLQTKQQSLIKLCAIMPEGKSLT